MIFSCQDRCPSIPEKIVAGSKVLMTQRWKGMERPSVQYDGGSSGVNHADVKCTNIRALQNIIRCRIINMCNLPKLAKYSSLMDAL